MRKVIIVQRSHYDSSQILISLGELDPSKKENVFCTESPHEALKALKSHPNAVVIMGGHFEDAEVYDAFIFAPMIREVGNEALLYIYSSLSEQQPEAADGFISKAEAWYDNIAQMLNTVEETTTAEELQEQFGFIKPIKSTS